LPLPSSPAGDAWKMSVSGLKAELKFLESIFDPNHERFRIIDWKPDELSCQFNVTGDKLLIIHCNITESYPSTPPIWFVDSDDPSLAQVLERLDDVRRGSTLVTFGCLSVYFIKVFISFCKLILAIMLTSYFGTHVVEMLTWTHCL
ncbi:unnamed protein product, partial [Tetraodon nigroviridis]